jgi:hypothetical protein
MAYATPSCHPFTSHALAPTMSLPPPLEEVFLTINTLDQFASMYIADYGYTVVVKGLE